MDAIGAIAILGLALIFGYGTWKICKEWCKPINEYERY